MRRLFIFLALLCIATSISGAAMAQSVLQPKEEVEKEDFTKQYFDRCMEIPDPHQSEASQADMCLCHTVHMQEVLPVEQMQTLATGKRTGAYVDKDTLFLEIYAPCLEFPAGELALVDCYNDGHVRGLVSTQNAYRGTCHCMKRRAEEYFRDLAQAQLAVLMKYNPTLEDPLGALRGTMEYMNEMADAKLECLTLYQGQWEKFTPKQ